MSDEATKRRSDEGHQCRGREGAGVADSHEATEPRSHEGETSKSAGRRIETSKPASEPGAEATGSQPRAGAWGSEGASLIVNPQSATGGPVAGAPGSDQSTLDAAWRALETVTDPEIPVLNVVELGIIAEVRLADGGVAIDVTPTFAACPAIGVMREGIREAVATACGCDVTVSIVFDPPWSSERISESGRTKLKAFGLAPPRGGFVSLSVPDLVRVPCPHCDSTETDLESPFGPTLCRSIHYCHSCRQSFEHFKPV